MEKEIIIQKVSNFCNEQNLFNNGVEIGEDSNGLTYVICQDWKQHDQIENFLNSIEDGLPNMSRMSDYIEIGFSDEYTFCSNCNKIIRTSPTSYGWSPDFWVGDGFIECGECTRSNPENYIGHLVNNTSIANTILSHKELTEQGFKKLNEEYQNGFHQGMNDNPKEIYNRLKGQHSEIIFNISENSQFYTTFEVYIREE
jgi:hypothetical protein